jgi:hypothetical protein
MMMCCSISTSDARVVGCVTRCGLERSDTAHRASADTVSDDDDDDEFGGVVGDVGVVFVTTPPFGLVGISPELLPPPRPEAPSRSSSDLPCRSTKQTQSHVAVRNVSGTTSKAASASAGASDASRSSHTHVSRAKRHASPARSGSSSAATPQSPCALRSTSAATTAETSREDEAADEAASPFPPC